MRNKFTLLLVLFFSLTNICYSQSGWVSSFFNNTRTIEKILQRDSTNYIALCSYSQYYYKSIDAGNTWKCTQDYAFDSVYSIYDGQFLNSQTGWIVGDGIHYNGVILKTTNGGLNWIRQNTGINNFGCYCICFLNISTGWIGSSGGTDGLLLKTTNGGNNWSVQNFPGSYGIGYVKLFDNNNGWLLGDYIVAQTTNGGLNWIQKPINNIPCSHWSYSNLYALNMSECWCLVTCTPNYTLVFSHIFKTTNGGDNWNLMYSYTDSLTTNSHSLWDINFINSSTGFSNGDFSFIVRTTNSGSNWDRINVGSGGTYPIITSLLPINNTDIFAAGGYSGLGSYRPFNYILKSTNTGSNWQFKTYNWEYNFSKIFFIDNNTGYVDADTGKIFRTTNAGTNWELIFNNNNYYVGEMSFVNSMTGCVIGTINYHGRILRTTNEGIDWNEIFNSTYLSLNTIKFVDQQKGYVGCDSNNLLTTTNTGLNWSLRNLSDSIAFYILSISFINNNTGWLLGHHIHGGYPYPYYERNIFWKTTDGGINWIIVFDSVGSMYNYYAKFLDNETGYKLSFNIPGIHKTTNGGSNWYPLSIPYSLTPHCIDFANVNTGWIAGSNGQFSGVLVKTTNSGINWILQFNEYNKIVNSVFVIDSSHAWFCGDYSSIYKTTNGGGIIGVSNIKTQLPKSFSLSQNYPNPFNPVTRIKFDLPKSSNVKLIIYDVLGREIEMLINENKKPGTYEVDWPATGGGSSYASGVYFYKLVTDEYVETKKMVLLK